MNAPTSDPADAVRAQILKHAEALFAHFGFNKTNIGDIAERSAMSPGNLYRYFRNKQAIGLAVVRHYFALSEAAMDEALNGAGPDAEARIRCMIETGAGHLICEMDANPRIVELADFLCSDQDGQIVLAAHLAWRRERLAAEIARGIDQGTLAPGDAGALAGAVHAALKPFFTPMMLAMRPAHPPVTQELHAVLDLLFHGLQARP